MYDNIFWYSFRNQLSDYIIACLLVKSSCCELWTTCVILSWRNNLTFWEMIYFFGQSLTRGLILLSCLLKQTWKWYQSTHLPISKKGNKHIFQMSKSLPLSFLSGWIKGSWLWRHEIKFDLSVRTQSFSLQIRTFKTLSLFLFFYYVLCFLAEISTSSLIPLSMSGQ